jgi:hypothetical protein
MMKKFLYTDDPAGYLKEHIIRGDSGDGIPNFLSASDTLVLPGVRQKPIRKDRLAEWMLQKPEELESELLTNFMRNAELIDFDRIPEEISGAILTEFKSYETNPRSKIMPYFMKNRLRLLFEVMGDF